MNQRTISCSTCRGSRGATRAGRSTSRAPVGRRGERRGALRPVGRRRARPRASGSREMSNVYAAAEALQPRIHRRPMSRGPITGAAVDAADPARAPPPSAVGRDPSGARPSSARRARPSPTAPARRRGASAIRPPDAVDPARPTTAAAAGRPHTLDAIRGGRPPGRRPLPPRPAPPPPSRRNTRDSLPSRNAVTRRKNGGSSHPTITHFVSSLRQRSSDVNNLLTNLSFFRLNHLLSQNHLIHVVGN